MPISKKPRKSGKKIKHLQVIYYYYDENNKRHGISKEAHEMNKMVNTHTVVRQESTVNGKFNKATGTFNQRKSSITLVPNGFVRTKTYSKTIRHTNDPRINELFASALYKQ